MQTEEVSRPRLQASWGFRETSKTSSPADLRLMALDHHRLVSACGHPAGTKTSTGGESQSRDETRREDNRANRRWKPFGFAHLFPSLMPLSAVVPSLLTNRRRLLSEKAETQKLSLPKKRKDPTDARLFSRKYLQYCWYLQSFGFGQFFPRYHQHPFECRSPTRGGSPPCPASAWDQMPRWKITVRILSIFF